jgi:hypothetical protein|tara:strand:+ start:142 stop:300 length:159 start_codon:yes stop_codon:yes gene_type:complete
MCDFSIKKIKNLFKGDLSLNKDAKHDSYLQESVAVLLSHYGGGIPLFEYFVA